MGKVDDIGGIAAAALDASDGVMEVVQVLVVCLAATGALDTAEFTRLLVSWRQTHATDGSMQSVLVERMLGMLVEDPKSLLRKAVMRLVQDQRSAESTSLPEQKEDVVQS